MRVVVGITGASGSVYGIALVRSLAEAGCDVDVILSDMGRKVLSYECGATPEELACFARVRDDHDLFSDIASGSACVDAMAVAPCSMSTLGQIASGGAETLLTRCASVALKERKPLVLLAREAPLSLINLENMCRVTRAGGCVFPASPGFYSRPTEIWQLVQQVVARVCDLMGVRVDNPQRWRGGDA